MSTYRLTPAARRDLSRIWDYSEERWGRQQAEVRPGYRSRAVGSHVVFYVISAGGVDVIRVLHQRMDPDRHV